MPSELKMHRFDDGDVAVSSCRAGGQPGLIVEIDREGVLGGVDRAGAGGVDALQRDGLPADAGRADAALTVTGSARGRGGGPAGAPP